jgi:conjugal transfer/type IV secretion protein DotA/TraY
MNISKRKALKYVLLPEILPRIGAIVSGGFMHIAYLTALLYYAVRLLPAHHPYLKPANFGRYGIRHVIAAAAQNLTYRRKNLDQIFIFYLILVGMVILLAQIILMGITLISQPVYAMALPNASFFEWFTIRTGGPLYPFNENNDIALMTLDRVFGVEGIFNSCISTAVACEDHNGLPIAKPPGAYPWPMHLALHSLFQMYSIGISIISLIIICYFITTIIGETAVSGTPFGQRFNRSWAPVRLIVFFALLAPLNLGETNAGLNGAQLITLWTAKFGSNFATNAWGYFNGVTTRAQYTPEQLIAVPQLPEYGTLPQFFSLVYACTHGEKLSERQQDVRPWIVRGRIITTGAQPPIDQNSIPLATTLAVDALTFAQNGNLKIRWGIKDTTLYAEHDGGVLPVCGELSIPTIGTREAGARFAFFRYYFLVGGSGGAASNSYFRNSVYEQNLRSYSDCMVERKLSFQTPCRMADGAASERELIDQHFDALNQNAIDDLSTMISAQISDAGAYAIPDELLSRGWAGAAIWYNRIAQINGSLVTAVNSVPKPNRFPEIMEQVKSQRLSAGESLSGSELYKPQEPGDAMLSLEDGDYKLANAYYEIYKTWDTENTPRTSEVSTTGNIFMDTINLVFGTSGLIDLRRVALAPTGPGGPGGDIHPGNAEVHPLALLSALGRAMVEASVRNLGISFGSGIMALMSPASGKVALTAISNFFRTVGTITISTGIVLFYVLPFLPFIYFLFALSGWVKSIFEAMVAMPLWALAHLRIDGEGLPGPGATNGYYLLLEIFLRPILTLFGLIGSIIIFAAMVSNLNLLFEMMVVNVGGSDREAGIGDIDFWRGPLDELFFTVIYAVVVYMLALSCFKLIDSVPNQILRFIGASVSTFQEGAGDPAGQLTSQVSSGSQLTLNQITGALNPGQIAALASAPR